MENLIPKIRHRLSKAVCFLLGHLDVSLDTLPKMLTLVVPTRADAICLRCYRRLHVVQAIADDVFRPSPILEFLRKKEQSQ